MKKLLKISLYVLGSLLLLLVLVFLWVNSNWGQNFIRGKAVAFLEDKLKTEVKLGKLDLAIPNYIELHDVFVRDRAQDTLASIGRLKVEISMLKLISNKIEIQNLELENTYANLYRNYPDTTFNFDFIAQSFSSDAPQEPEQKKDTTSTIDISVDDVKFNNIRFNFLDYSGGVQFRIALDTLKLKGKKTDISTLTFHVKDLMLAGITSSVKVDTSIIPPDTSSSSAAPAIIVDKLDLSRTNFAFDDLQAPKQKEGIDYVHLDLKDVAINIDDAYYTLDSTSGNINRITAKEQSGLYLQEFRSQMAYYDKGAFLKELFLKTNHTTLQHYLEIKYDSVGMLSERPGDMHLAADLQNSVVGISDILIFAPDLREQDLFRNNANEQLQLATTIKGFMHSLSIDNFYLAGLNNTVVDLSGVLNGLPDADKINYDFNIARIKSTEKDVVTFIPEEVTADIDLPDNFELTGKISGTTLDYNPDIRLVSTDGSATVKGYLHMSGGEGNEKYRLYVTTDKLDIGSILKQDSTLDRITANIQADGAGFDIKKMNAVLKGDISALGAMGYTYNGITLNGKIKEQLADIEMTSEDENADFNLSANADLRNEYPALKGKLQADSINLRALNLISDSLALRTLINFDIPTLNPDYPYGDIVIEGTGVDAPKARYYVDTFKIIARSSADTGQNIRLEGNFARALITGKLPLTKSGAFIQQQINKYYASQSAIDTAITNHDYDLGVNVTVLNKPLWHTLIPGLGDFNPITLESKINNSKLYLSTTIPELSYQDMFIDSGRILVENSSENILAYKVSMNNFSAGAGQFWYPTLSGQLSKEKITADVVIKDIERKDRFAFYASMVSDSIRQIFKLENDMLLNYNEWQVNPGNKLVIQGDGLYADSFTLSHNKGSINIQSEQQNPSAPMDVTIKDFSIADITQVLQEDTTLANGLLNSKLKVQNVMTEPKATGTLSIDSLAVMNHVIGSLKADLKEASPNEVATDITLKGRGNDLAITGSYYASPVNNNNFDLAVDINTLDMKSAQGLAMNQLKNSSGRLKGQLKLTGTTDKPDIKGELQTDSLKTTLTLLGSPFMMPAEKLAISNDKIELNDFTIIDEYDNEGVVDGSVDITSLSDPQLDLKVNAEKWQVLNSTKEENELFYGRVLISSDLNLKGAAAAPSIDGNLTIHDSTDFTIVVPESNPGIEEREGVVVFVDNSAPAGYQQLIDKDTISGFAVKAGTDLNLNVEIEDNALFNVVIDQASGDLLRVQGEANLNTQVNPDGTIGLAGVYVLKDGSYELNYSLVKRRFEIQEGSEIKFAGDPMKAEVDITAEYTANIPPYELVQNEIEEQNEVYYKQRLPFSVVLKLTGELMEPEVNFDITLPEERNYRANSEVVTIVKGKLNQLRNNPSEMNKQVFAALILNKFLASDPFQSLGGTSAEYVARQSASRFISAQLNRLAEEFVKGLEINLDLQSTEDYTTGEKRNRTDLNLSATKRLFNDRLSVTVGNNFELEGAEEGNNNNANLIPGNLAADYQLTKDGRYLVRVFRRRDNINIVEGVSVETGVSFVITLDYDRFRNIFLKKDAMRKEEDDNLDDEPKGTN